MALCAELFLQEREAAPRRRLGDAGSAGMSHGQGSGLPMPLGKPGCTNARPPRWSVHACACLCLPVHASTRLCTRVYRDVSPGCPPARMGPGARSGVCPHSRCPSVPGPAATQLHGCSSPGTGTPRSLPVPHRGLAAPRGAGLGAATWCLLGLCTGLQALRAGR